MMDDRRDGGGEGSRDTGTSHERRAARSDGSEDGQRRAWPALPLSSTVPPSPQRMCKTSGVWESAEWGEDADDIQSVRDNPGTPAV